MDNLKKIQKIKSGKYRIQVRGLPKYYGIGELKAYLRKRFDSQEYKLKIPCLNSPCIYLSFKTGFQRIEAMKKLDGCKWKRGVLDVQLAEPEEDPILKKKELAKENINDEIVAEEVDEMTAEFEVKQSTIPYWDKPYSRQLELKQRQMRKLILLIGKRIWKHRCGGIRAWIKHQDLKYDGLCCELLPILSTEKITGYRNKCEFTIGKSKNGDKIVIGFRLCKYIGGSTAVGPIDDLCHIPTKMKVVVKVLEEFVKDSKLDPFDPVYHSGYWRQVTVRVTRCDDVMVIIGMHPQDLTCEKMEELKLQLKDLFENGKGVEAGVTSLYFQIMKNNAKDVGEGNLFHVSGTKYITETLMDMKFRVSPQAFFQVNTSGAEVLYKAAIDLARVNRDTAVIDICCGTGTIGLVFSKYCGEVFGIETVEDAIKDARENMVRNDVYNIPNTVLMNCEFFVGKAENILRPVIRRVTRPEIIVVMDPPRAGLHRKVIQVLRSVSKLSRIVYIACDPKAAIKNFVDFGRPTSKQYAGAPFLPTKAIAVDMFPHTKHCELIVCLERLPTHVELMSEDESFGSNTTSSFSDIPLACFVESAMDEAEAYSTDTE